MFFRYISGLKWQMLITQKEKLMGSYSSSFSSSHWVLFMNKSFESLRMVPLSVDFSVFDLVFCSAMFIYCVYDLILVSLHDALIYLLLIFNIIIIISRRFNCRKSPCRKIIIKCWKFEFFLFTLII